MREHKFRAWCKKEKRFHYYDIDLLLKQTKNIERDYKEFQQFVGLKDKNGKKIYEGDIVKISDYDNPLICEVKCKNLWKGLTFKQLSKGLFLTQGYKSEKEMGDNCEVIGNIYENPELLEEK